MNVGLGLMVVLSLLPIGLLQAAASIDDGLWFARSAEFLQQPHIEVLRWLRIVGDTVFLAGVAALGWFVLGLLTGRSVVVTVPAREGEIPGDRPARETAGRDLVTTRNERRS
jgi:nitric oxide reductase subunit B